MDERWVEGRGQGEVRREGFGDEICAEDGHDKHNSGSICEEDGDDVSGVGNDEHRNVDDYNGSDDHMFVTLQCCFRSHMFKTEDILYAALYFVYNVR